MPTVTTQFAPGLTARPKAAGLFAPRTLLSDVFSFEMVYLAFFFSNQFELILPKLPVDLTVLFFGLTLVLGAVVVAREGIYLPGLLLVAALLPWLAWVNFQRHVDAVTNPGLGISQDRRYGEFVVSHRKRDDRRT